MRSIRSEEELNAMLAKIEKDKYYYEIVSDDKQTGAIFRVIDPTPSQGSRVHCVVLSPEVDTVYSDRICIVDFNLDRKVSSKDIKKLKDTMTKLLDKLKQAIVNF